MKVTREKRDHRADADGDAFAPTCANQVRDSRLDHLRDGDIANPAQGQAGNRDAELRSGDVEIGIVLHLQHRAHSLIIGARLSLQPPAARRHQGKFNRDKETVSRNQGRYGQQAWEEKGESSIH